MKKLIKANFITLLSTLGAFMFAYVFTLVYNNAPYGSLGEFVADVLSYLFMIVTVFGVVTNFVLSTIIFVLSLKEE